MAHGLPAQSPVNSTRSSAAQRLRCPLPMPNPWCSDSCTAPAPDTQLSIFAWDSIIKFCQLYSIECSVAQCTLFLLGACHLQLNVEGPDLKGPYRRLITMRCSIPEGPFQAQLTQDLGWLTSGQHQHLTRSQMVPVECFDCFW